MVNMADSPGEQRGATAPSGPLGLCWAVWLESSALVVALPELFGSRLESGHSFLQVEFSGGARALRTFMKVCTAPI